MEVNQALTNDVTPWLNLANDATETLDYSRVRFMKTKHLRNTVKLRSNKKKGPWNSKKLAWIQYG
jgi:hypothetical protein